MGVVLPESVAIFLNFLGIPWINVDEDHVRQTAGHVRTFVSDLENTLDSANDRMAALQDDYSGSGYQQLLAEWAAVDRTHMSILRTGGGVVAGALDAAATTIAAMKVASIAEIAALATAAGALLLSGGAALEPLVAAAARRVVTALKYTIEEFVFGEILESALARFEDVVQRFVEGITGFAYRATAALLDVPDVAGQTMHLNPDEVRRHADALTALGDEVAQHYARFSDNLAKIGSGSSESIDPEVDERKPITTPTGPTETARPNPGDTDNGARMDPRPIDDPRPRGMDESAATNPRESTPTDPGESTPANPNKSAPTNPAVSTSTDDHRPQRMVADPSRYGVPDGAKITESERTGASGTIHPSNSDRAPSNSDRSVEPSLVTPTAHRSGPAPLAESDPVDQRPIGRELDRAIEYDSSTGPTGTEPTSTLGSSSSGLVEPPRATATPESSGAIISGPTRPPSNNPWSRRNHRPEQSTAERTNLGSAAVGTPHAQRRPAIGEEPRTPWTKSKRHRETAAPPAAVSADPASRVGAAPARQLPESDLPNSDAEPRSATSVEAPAASPPPPR